LGGADLESAPHVPAGFERALPAKERSQVRTPDVAHREVEATVEIGSSIR
jgi:hypothetical protein